MAQPGADLMDGPLDNVTVELCDSTCRGSFTTCSVGSAIAAACRAVQRELLRLAQRAAGSSLKGAKLDDVVFADGKIGCKDGSTEVSLADAMRAGKLTGSRKRRAPRGTRRANTPTNPLGDFRRGEGRRGAERVRELPITID
jgi:CO/xanthine dehydrogenase Mo-binding subunit